jgi:hypothetical protein
VVGQRVEGAAPCVDEDGASLALLLVITVNAGAGAALVAGCPVTLVAAGAASLVPPLPHAARMTEPATTAAIGPKNKREVLRTYSSLSVRAPGATSMRSTDGCNSGISQPTR